MIASSPTASIARPGIVELDHHDREFRLCHNTDNLHREGASPQQALSNELLSTLYLPDLRASLRRR
jgi:hypothetical protein